jgi:hypothetical protein
MNKIILATALSLLIFSICSCGGGDSTTDDCSSIGSTSIPPSSPGKVVAATISSVQSDASSYSIVASNLDAVSGIQLDITYDAALLSTPTVTQGALVTGAMFAANTSRPGLIKIAVISTHPFSGNGPIALISFASKTGSGGITSITAYMIYSQGPPTDSVPSNPTTGIISSPGVPFTRTACR